MVAIRGSEKKSCIRAYMAVYVRGSQRGYWVLDNEDDEEYENVRTLPNLVFVLVLVLVLDIGIFEIGSITLSGGTVYSRLDRRAVIFLSTL